MVLISFVSVAFFTLLDRKVLGYGQIRKGPNKSVFMGVLLPLVDGVKLFFKNFMFPNSTIFPLVLLGGVIVFCSMVFTWVVVNSFFGGLESVPFILMVLFISGFSVVGVFTMGLFSSGVYSYLGVLRSVAQMVSYEVVMGLVLLVLVVFSLSLYSLMRIPVLLVLVFVPTYLLAVIMEVNRTPVDFLEGESELVSGGVTELGGLVFALMFMGEYGFMAVYSVLLSIYVFGCVYVSVVFMGILLMSWLRLSLPRFRYDLLMLVSWKFMMPLIMVLILVVWGLI
uniref:NADH-ubiquinone oxidoreductase chain 1 n=1 Tax=Acanthogyrus cheni TaxID=1381719 RepID=A0A1W5PWL7_9BILA|nr:NADH dehydrogenase subunit 1 [Acanthogyrus cheni]